MKILFLSPVASLGGAERSLLDMTMSLREIQPDCPIEVLLGETGPLQTEMQQQQVPTEVVAMSPAIQNLGESEWLWNKQRRWIHYGEWGYKLLRASLELPAYLRRLQRAVRHRRPHILHSNGLKCHLLAGWIAPPGCAVVWHLRDFLASRPLLGRWLPRWPFPPDVVIANSHAVASEVRRLFPRVRVETIHNGIDTEYFSPEGSRYCWPTWNEGGTNITPSLRIGLIATYARWKGQDVFLNAASRLVDSGIHNVYFYIIGGPAYRTSGSQWTHQELEQLIQDRGLAGRCHLIPFQHETAPVYRGLDVVVHASVHPEPFGRTVAEAMACGRAVIVSAAGGAVELFTDGVDALGVPPGDADRLAAAMKRLIQDAELRRRLGQAARQTAVTRFDRRRMGERLLEVYRSLNCRRTAAPVEDN